MSKAVVIAGVAVAPGEVVCGVRGEELPPVGRPFHGDLEPVPMTEEARHLTGMGRYLSLDWDIPSCPVIGKEAHEHCKHGIGNLDYCPHCEHENDDLSFADMEI